MDQLIDKCYSANSSQKFLEKYGSITLHDLLITARAQEVVDLQMVAIGNTNSEQVNNVTDTALNGDTMVTGGVVLTAARMTILQGIDVLEGVINVTSVEKSVILKWCRRGKDQVCIAGVGKLSKR